jgi:FxLD family lantipeptide
MDIGTLANTPEQDILDLEIEFLDSVPVVADLMRSTDNGCGSTNQSACAGC